MDYPPDCQHWLAKYVNEKTLDIVQVFSIFPAAPVDGSSNRLTARDLQAHGIGFDSVFPGLRGRVFTRRRMGAVLVSLFIHISV